MNWNIQMTVFYVASSTVTMKHKVWQNLLLWKLMIIWHTVGRCSWVWSSSTGVSGECTALQVIYAVLLMWCIWRSVQYWLDMSSSYMTVLQPTGQTLLRIFPDVWGGKCYSTHAIILISVHVTKIPFSNWSSHCMEMIWKQWRCFNSSFVQCGTDWWMRCQCCLLSFPSLAMNCIQLSGLF
jgi:hypothetical protein